MREITCPDCGVLFVVTRQPAPCPGCRALVLVLDSAPRVVGRQITITWQGHIPPKQPPAERKPHLWPKLAPMLLTLEDQRIRRN